MTYHYLASPYSHPSPVVMHERYLAAQRATAWLLARRVWVYSPIVHCHELVQEHRFPADFEFWRGYNFAMIGGAEGFLVLDIEGTEQSKGVKGEVEEAIRLGLRMRLVRPRPDLFPPTYELGALHSLHSPAPTPR